MKTELKTWGKRTISLQELKKLLHSTSDAELYELISEAEENGILSPVKASGTNGNRVYPLYLKYRVALQDKQEEAETQKEIAMLHPLLTKNGYLQGKLSFYQKYREPIQKLNRFLFSGQKSVPVSKKERSFAIFGDEKKLEDSGFVLLLKHLDLTEEALGYYDTPEYCFNDFIPDRKDHMVLLICENKDIWFNIRRRMYEDGAGRIFGTRIDGCVYGCGNRISQAGALSEYTRFMGTKQAEYLYWGDIDRAGLNIYLSLLKNNPGMNIRLFIPAYEAMLKAAENREIPDSLDHRERMGAYEEIYRLFPEEGCAKLAAYINENKRVPQEIISYETLLEAME